MEPEGRKDEGHDVGNSGEEVEEASPDADEEATAAAELLLQRLATQFGDLDVHGMVLGGDSGGGGVPVVEMNFSSSTFTRGDSGDDKHNDGRRRGDDGQSSLAYDGVVGGGNEDTLEEEEKEDDEIPYNQTSYAATPEEIEAWHAEQREKRLYTNPEVPILVATEVASFPLSPSTATATARQVVPTTKSSSSNNVSSSFASSSSSHDDDDDDIVEPTPEEIAAWQAEQHAKGRSKLEQRRKKLLQSNEHHDINSSNPIFRHRQKLLQMQQLRYKQRLQQRQRRSGESKEVAKEQKANGDDDDHDVLKLLTGPRKRSDDDDAQRFANLPQSFLLQHYLQAECRRETEWKKFNIHRRNGQSLLKIFLEELVQQDPIVLDTTARQQPELQPWKLLMTSLEDGLSFESLWHTLEGYAGPLVVFMNVVSSHATTSSSDGADAVSSSTNSTTSTVLGFMTTSTWYESPIDSKTKTPLYFGSSQCPTHISVRYHDNDGGVECGYPIDDEYGGEGDCQTCLLFGWNTYKHSSFISPRNPRWERQQQGDHSGDGDLMYCHHPKQQRHHHHHHHHHHHSLSRTHASSSSSSSLNRITHGLGIGGTGSCYQIPRLHITPTLTDCTCGTYDELMEPGDVLLPPSDFPCYKFDILDIEVWGVGGTEWIQYALDERSKLRSRRQASNRRTIQAGAKAIYSDHQKFYS